jgi:hypothetical protein
VRWMTLNELSISLPPLTPWLKLMMMTDHLM